MGANVMVPDAVVTAVKSAGASHGFFLQDATATRFADIYVFVGSAARTVFTGSCPRRDARRRRAAAWRRAV